MVDDIKELVARLKGDKKLHIVLGNDPSLLYGRISFKIPVLDRLTGGGVPRKRMTLITGPTGSCKSYLASQAAVSVQQSGGAVGWVDTELSWDIDWMEKCGVNTEGVALNQPRSGEEAFLAVRTFAQAGFDLIVLDSIAGLVPSNVQEEDFAYSPMAWQARFVNQSLPRILPHLQDDTALIVINQLRSSIGPVAMGTLPGGEAQKFFAHFLLRTSRGGWIKDTDDSKMGFDVKVELQKSKVDAEHFQSIVMPFKVEGGIDLLETIINDALDKNLIKQTGAWYTWQDRKLQGRVGLKNFFLEDAEQRKLLDQAVEDAS